MSHEEVAPAPIEPTKPVSHVRAVYVGPGHFAYSGQFPKKQELCIIACGWKARVLGVLFRASQW